MSLDELFNDIIPIIKPSKGEEDEIKATINNISNFMKSNTPFEIKKTIVSGSFGKKTNLKDNYEVDLVYVINKETNIEKLLDLLKEVKSYIIENNLGSEPQVKKKAVCLKRKNVEVDILPGYEVLSPREIQNLEDKDFYEGSTSLFHLQYAKERGPIYTNTVRVIKQWRNNCLNGNLKNVASFALELTFGGIFDQYRSEINNVNKGFKKFLEYVSESNLNIFVDVTSTNPFTTDILSDEILHLKNPGDFSNIIEIDKGQTTAIRNCANYTLKRYNGTALRSILGI